jgi:hypothetical protein
MLVFGTQLPRTSILNYMRVSNPWQMEWRRGDSTIRRRGTFTADFLILQSKESVMGR